MKNWILALLLLSILPSVAFADGVALTSLHASEVQSSPFWGLPSAEQDRMQGLLDQTLPDPTNCWGAALYAAGFIERPRPAAKAELLYFLNSKACRKLGPEESVQAGDIASIYHPTDGIYHSYIILNSSRIFQKASPEENDVPGVRTVFDEFQQDLDIRSGCKYSTSTCNWGIVNYRCDAKKIEDVKSENAKVDVAFKTRIRYLIAALKSELESDASKAAVNEAFKQVIQAVLGHLNSTSSDRTRNLVSEGDGVGEFLIVFTKYSDQLVGTDELAGKLNSENLNAFDKFAEQIEAIEDSTPKKVEDFSPGAL